MLPTEYCLVNLFAAVLGKLLWEGSVSTCCPCVVVAIYSISTGVEVAMMVSWSY